MLILDIIEKLIMCIIPVTLGYIILKYIFFELLVSSGYPKNWLVYLKYAFMTFGIFFTAWFILSTIAVNIFVVASVFKTYEIENAKVIDSWVKDMCYICIEGAWSVTGAVLILYLYQHIGKSKILSSSGSVKQCIKQIIKEAV